MRQTKEEMQDRLMIGIDKLNKKNPSNIKKEPTLAEQLKTLENWDKLTENEKLKHLSYRDYETGLKDFLSKKSVCTSRRFANIFYGERMHIVQSFHQKGASYVEVQKWIEANHPNVYE